MKEHSSPEDIQYSIDLATKIEKRPWSQIGDLLDQVDTIGFWQGNASSFSEWLRSFAQRLGLKEASLWRYLASARYYKNLANALNKKGIECPQLVDLPGAVSPENLELLAKLERVLPDDVYKETVIRVLNGSITRAELRKIWGAYKPVLGGRTARGIGVEAPRANPADPRQHASLTEGRIFNALMASGPAWLGIKNPYLFEILHHVSPEFSDSKMRCWLDAVVITSQARRAVTDYHGIEIRPDLTRCNVSNSQFYARLERQRPYCHYVWVALEEFILDLASFELPQYVGVLIVSGSQVQVLRPAERGEGELTGDLAKGLLVRAMGR